MTSTHILTRTTTYTKPITSTHINMHTIINNNTYTHMHREFDPDSTARFLQGKEAYLLLLRALAKSKLARAQVG
jgi:hypothetical protein